MCKPLWYAWIEEHQQVGDMGDCQTVRANVGAPALCRRGPARGELLRKGAEVTEAEFHKRLSSILGASPLRTVDELLAEVEKRIAGSRTVLLVADGCTWRHPIDLDEVRACVEAALLELIDRGDVVYVTDLGREQVRYTVACALEARWPDAFSVVVRPPRRCDGDRRFDVLLHPRSPSSGRGRDVCPGPCDHTLVVARFGA